MQSLFFIALFRRQTRDVVLRWVERVLPARIPFLPLRNPPARAMNLFITGHIQAFQDGVAKRAAARAADHRYVGELAALMMMPSCSSPNAFTVQCFLDKPWCSICGGPREWVRYSL